MSADITKKIKLMVSNDNIAVFDKYFDGALWYYVVYTELPDSKTEEWEAWEAKSFEFPVPVDDIHGATFHAQEKALLLMRYIRAHLSMLELEKAKMEQCESAGGS